MEVYHEAVDGGSKAKELGELVVSTRHVDTTGGAEDQVGDFGFGLAPFLYGLCGSLFAKFGDFHHNHVLPSVQGRCHELAQIGIVLEDFFG
ncbi:hypothetical protein RHMOL_Rhmol09G0057700 [Rhododendron molle]|uniref:Uncharacterized protein n=1 Tax=Rhododendron molle TaxID=49168 RepID=A0ACC0MAF9_RHOML|nr:hypothetical protein RHMOL_Rhmol09G0057700 [Rhododendron molle]